MRHIFIVNPHSGPQDMTNALREALSSHPECELYVTSHPGDATAYVRAVCASGRNPVRFYACGGDGTLHEVVNGAAGFAHAAVGCYPSGSGNDFVKYYGGKTPFLNIEALLHGCTQPIDLIRVNDCYAINVVNFGFDALAAGRMVSFRRFPLLKGKRAYYASIPVTIIDGMRTRCSVQADGQPLYDGDLTLCTIANAQYMGGSFLCAPRASLCDGLLEVCAVKPISRLRLARIIGTYQRGKHLDDPRLQDIILYRRAKKLEITAPSKDFLLCLDGELIRGDHFSVEVLPSALSFILPEGAAHVEDNAYVQEAAV